MNAARRSWTSLSSQRSSDNEAALTPDERRLLRILSGELIAVVVTQKLAMPLSTAGGHDQIAMAEVIHLGVLGLLAILGYLRVASLRMFFFCMFTAAALGSLLRLPGGTYSLPSVFLVLIILVTYIVVIPVRRLVFEAFLNRFSLVAFVAALLMLLCWATQIVGLGVINLDAIIPDILVLRYFNYMNPLSYGSPWIKPHGVFFLEVSFASQFVAIGMIIEFMFFRRPLLLFIQLVALATSYGGTGMSLVLLTFPFLINRVRPVLIVGMVCLGLAGIGVLNAAGILDSLLARTQEFGTPHTSAHTRFILPAEYAIDSLGGDTMEALFGKGPGTMPKTAAGENNRPDFRQDDFAWSAYSKAVCEYGAITALPWLLLVITGMFGRGVPFAIGWMAALQYHILNAAFAAPLPTVYAYLLAGAWYVVNGKEAEESAAIREKSSIRPSPVPALVESRLHR